jgi:hypothetical protein
VRDPISRDVNPTAIENSVCVADVRCATKIWTLESCELRQGVRFVDFWRGLDQSERPARNNNNNNNNKNINYRYVGR